MNGVTQCSPGEVGRSLNAPFLGHLDGGSLASSLLGKGASMILPLPGLLDRATQCPPPWGGRLCIPPPRPTAKWSLLSNYLPCEGRQFHEPYHPGCYNPRFSPDASFPYPLIPYFFLFWEGAFPFLSLPSLPMSCPVSLSLHMTGPISPPSYDSHNFPPHLESVIDSRSDSPGLSESGTDSVASPSPSELAYDADSKNEVLYVVFLFPKFGGRPCYNVKQRPSVSFLDQRGQRIPLALSC